MRTDWTLKNFEDVFQDCSGGNQKVLQSSYRSSGRYAVVDQGRELIAGYVDDCNFLCKAQDPTIIFGDHTRALKFVDFPFCMGADGVKVLKPKVRADVKYLYHYLRSKQIPEAGYSRHYKYLKRLQIVLPPLEEQRRIAAILDQAEALRAKRRQSLAKLDTLTQSLYLRAVAEATTKPFTFQQIANFTTGKLDSNAAVVGGRFPFFTCAREDAAIDVPAFDCEALLLAGNNAAGEYSVKHFQGKFNAYQRTYVITLDNSLADYRYMRLALSAKLRELKHSSKGTGTKYLTLEILQRVKFDLPPLSVQRKLSAQLTGIDRQRSKHAHSRNSLDDLLIGLKHKAFRGEL